MSDSFYGQQKFTILADNAPLKKKVFRVIRLGVLDTTL